MLLHFESVPRTTSPRWARLLCLERHVRQASWGRYKIQDYREWLDAEHLPQPRRQALHDDFALYAKLCDDVDYGSHGKWLSILPAPNHDAIAWFLGYAWLRSPLQPRLSSSVARCLLLAQIHQREVILTYAKLEQQGRMVTDAEVWRAIPFTLIPGLDSAYMGFWIHSGKIAHFNLARIIGEVKWTGNDSAQYAPPIIQDEKTTLAVQGDDRLLDKLAVQFTGWTQIPHDKTLSVNIPDELRFFSQEMLQGWQQRIIRRLSDLALSPLRWEITSDKADPSEPIRERK